ncbi:MAG: alpha/beta hydrolase [Alphaproteobacteria bacterium]|nr:alpha/beta hydrolase [Alphaproteobacteria bacterium]
MTGTDGDPERLTAAGTGFLAGGSEHASAPPLVCLHGIGGDATSFRAQIAGLAGPDQRVLSWDMPGYGGSAPLAAMDFAALCERLCAALDELGLGRVIIAGQSIGGMIAQEMAIRHPGRVAGLVLIATVPGFGGRDDSFRDAFLAARLAPLDQGVGMGALAAEAIPAVLGPHVDSTTRDDAIAAMAAIPEAAYRQVLATLVSFNRREDQHLITCPCLLIAGGKDDNSPARVMERMADRLPDAALLVIENAGHLVNSEAHRDCNKAIGAFLRRLRGSDINNQDQ